MKTSGIPVERINVGRPLIAPSEKDWESGGTINAAAVYLPRSPENDRLIRGLAGGDSLEALPDGVVAVFYRAVASPGAENAIPFSSIGLAVFTPDLTRLVHRFDAPVLSPGTEWDSFDYFGIEDPRITLIDGVYYMLYCGPRNDTQYTYKTRLCLATSRDLLHWEKHGPIPGGPDRFENKDGVLFPRQIGGKYYLLHRPWGPDFSGSDLSIWLASSESPDGLWKDHGEVLHSYAIPGCRDSWVGGGSVPIPLSDTPGEMRYLVIYHTGNYLNDTDREYDAGAALFDFSRFSPEDPHRLVVSRVEPLMAPETEYERSRLPDGGQLDVVFPCGSYEFRGDIYLIYGAGDHFTAAARVNRQILLEALEAGSLENPYLR